VNIEPNNQIIFLKLNDKNYISVYFTIRFSKFHKIFVNKIGSYNLNLKWITKNSQKILVPKSWINSYRQCWNRCNRDSMTCHLT